MNKIAALWGLFRKGEAVANPAAWKAGQITVTALAALLLAVARVAEAFGHALPIDQAAADAVAAGVIAAVNVVLTVTTSKSVGLPARSADRPAGTGDTGDDGGATGQPLIPGSGGG